MKCLHPYNLDPEGWRYGRPAQYVPCGKCLACKNKLASENAMRCYLELSSYDGSAVFVTLTYDDDHIPANRSLVKPDLQNFFKRLRRDNPDVRIRYFACGEYGDQFGRPHYHAIIYGFDCAGHVCKYCRDKRGKSCRTFCDNWSNGNVVVMPVNYWTCRYVSNYVYKKRFGDVQNVKYINKGLQPPYQVQSQGLGFEWFFTHLPQIMEYGVRFQGIRRSIPRAFLKKFEREVGKDGNSIDFVNSYVQFWHYLEDLRQDLPPLVPPPKEVVKKYIDSQIDKLRKKGLSPPSRPSWQNRIKMKNLLELYWSDGEKFEALVPPDVDNYIQYVKEINDKLRIYDY